MQNVDFGLYLKKKNKVYLQLKIKDKILIYIQNLVWSFFSWLDSFSNEWNYQKFKQKFPWI